MLRKDKCKDNTYVMLDKKFLSDVSLSWKAKGVLAYLMTLPDDFRVHEEDVAAHSIDKIDNLRTAMKELVDAGYVKEVTAEGESK